MEMLAVLAEHRSDAESLVAIIKNILGNPNASIARKGFSGSGELCRKAPSHIRQFARSGATHFIVCHDADGPSADDSKQKVKRLVVDQVESRNVCCILVPVQELEAWIIADEDAIRATIPS